MITSRNGKEANDTILTPRWLFDELELKFDLDVCHPSFETNVPCVKYYTEQDNCLKQRWEGLVFMNPPYSKPTPFVHKFIEHGNGIALLPISKSAWFDVIWASQASIKILPYSFKFELPNGEKKPIFMPVMLVGFGAIAINAIKKVKGSKLR